MSVAELLSLVEQYREAQQLIEAAQAEMDTIKATISAEMARRNVERMDVGTHKVTLKAVTTSRLDGKAIKAAAPRAGRTFHQNHHDHALLRGVKSQSCAIRLYGL